MAKKIKKYADGGDIYEGTDLARAMGVRGVPEPGLEAVYPEEYMGGVGSIKGVGGSAMKAVTPKAERVLSAGEKAALEKYAAKANKALPKYTQAEKDALARQLDKNVRKAPIQMYKNRANISGKGLPEETTKEITGELNFKKGGKVKASSASKRADGIATKGKTKGRII
jgi:hypothetical protein